MNCVDRHEFLPGVNEHEGTPESMNGVSATQAKKFSKMGTKGIGGGIPGGEGNTGDQIFPQEKKQCAPQPTIQGSELTSAFRLLSTVIVI